MPRCLPAKPRRAARNHAGQARAAPVGNAEIHLFQSSSGQRIPAVTGASPDCVSAILARGPDLTRVSTAEGNSALHTAVRMGYPATVKLLKIPELVEQTNYADLTPGQMMADILGDLPGWRNVMGAKRRKTGTEADYQACAAELGLT